MDKDENRSSNRINIDTLRLITYPKSQEFEFDETKSRSNVQKHGIDFVEAQRLWDAPYIKLGARKRGERRYLFIGRIDGRY